MLVACLSTNALNERDHRESLTLYRQAQDKNIGLVQRSTIIRVYSCEKCCRLDLHWCDARECRWQRMDGHRSFATINSCHSKFKLLCSEPPTSKFLFFSTLIRNNNGSAYTRAKESRAKARPGLQSGVTFLRTPPHTSPLLELRSLSCFLFSSCDMLCFLSTEPCLLSSFPARRNLVLRFVFPTSH